VQIRLPNLFISGVYVLRHHSVNTPKYRPRLGAVDTSRFSRPAVCISRRVDSTRNSFNARGLCAPSPPRQRPRNGPAVGCITAVSGDEMVAASDARAKVMQHRPWQKRICCVLRAACPGFALSTQVIMLLTSSATDHAGVKRFNAWPEWRRVDGVRMQTEPAGRYPLRAVC
jgi:hypothetical protein